MALVLSEDQQLLKDSAKSFCEQIAPVSLLRKLRDSKDEQGYDQAVWAQMIELGWAGMAVPESYGGFEFGYGGLGVVLEESGRTLLSSPLISTVLIGATALLELGNETQKQQLLPHMQTLMMSGHRTLSSIQQPNRPRRSIGHLRML